MVNVNDFDATADGSMIRVDVLDQAATKNNPDGQFVAIDQALMLEAQGKCHIRRKKDMQKKVMVEYLEQVLINSYGKFGVYNQGDAELGEKVGKWKIVRSDQLSGSYETQIMFPITMQGAFPDKQKYETKGVRKTKVAWVQDNFMLGGGAELSNQLVIRVGIDCGYLIDLVIPSMDCATIGELLSRSDVIIFNNIFGFAGEQIQTFLKSIYSERKPYVKYEHDHRELGRPEFSRRLFQNSILNVFLSPVHLKNHKQRLGVDGICLPLAIDVDHFKPVEGVGRKKGTAIICNVRNFKKWENLQKYINDHQEIQFTIMAKDSQIQGANVTVKEMIPYDQMPRLYSEFEYVVHILDGWGAGERVIFEGALCKCKIIANERVGHMSWGKDLTRVDDLRDWLTLAPYAFWKEIERKLKGEFHANGLRK